MPHHRFSRFVTVAIVMALSSRAALAAVHYVKWDAAGLNNGTSRADAFASLQSALDVAASGDEIRIARGTCNPTSDYGLGIGDRGKHFRMKNGVATLGGYEGEPGDARDPATYVTTLSGDIGTAGEDSDNCYHVFYHPTGTNLDPSAILDGLTVSDGNADGSSPHDTGGGMLNWEQSSPTLTNCTFSGNSAGGGGGLRWMAQDGLQAELGIGGNGGRIRGGDSAPLTVELAFVHMTDDQAPRVVSAPTVTTLPDEEAHFRLAGAGGSGPARFRCRCRATRNLDGAVRVEVALELAPATSGGTARLEGIIVSPRPEPTPVAYTRPGAEAYMLFVSAPKATKQSKGRKEKST